MSDTEDYEALREKNIAERNAFLQSFLKDIKGNIEELNKLEESKPRSEKENKAPKTPRSTKRRRSTRSPTYTGSRPRIEFKKRYNTRSKKKKADDNEDEQEHDFNDEDIIVPKKSSNLKVMFSWSRPMQRDIDLMRFDTDEEEDSGAESDEIFKEPKRKRIHKMSRSTYDPNSIPSPDEITTKMLNNIAPKASNKVYDAVNGTSCHQCRQKTKDTKTVCRSGECIGVRGQFCGPCLKGRYGESAYEALKDPNWACPPCRGLCNCSICRTRNGQRPTGILAPLAKEEGFSSVKDYLQAMDCTGEEEEEEDEDEEEEEED